MPERGAALERLAVALLVAVALLPLCGPVDLRLDWLVDPLRTCAGLTVAHGVSDLVQPVGLALLVIAAGRALVRGRPPAEVLGVLAALFAGVLLVGALKDFLDRPRPGAEFLTPGGGSFPSGHVGNTVLNGLAVWTLWSGREAAGRARRRLGWLLFVLAVAVVAAARVYGRRHWPSDVAGAIAVAGGYGVLAILHPDARHRTVATAVALALMGALKLAAANGVKLDVPAGSRAGRSTPVEAIDFGLAYRRGSLHGAWSAGDPDPRRSSAWLRAATGTLELPALPAAPAELRLVARPRDGLEQCERLAVALNGRVLGRRLLHPGWRSYTFPVDAAATRPDHNVLTLDVSDGGAALGPAVRRAAFGALTVHVGGATARP